MTTQETRISSHHSGPLPSPQTLADYEQLQPGSIERIFSMAEKEQESRIERERLQLAADIEHRNALTELQKNAHRGTFISDYLGQVMGFIVAMVCVVGAIYAGAFLDRPWVAAILVSVPTIGIINAVRGMKGSGKGR